MLPVGKWGKHGRQEILLRSACVEIQKVLEQRRFRFMKQKATVKYCLHTLVS